MTDTATKFEEKVKGYSHPDVLVSTEWVAEHLNDPNVRIVEADEDVLLYEVGHVPGAVKLDWHTELQDPVERDFVHREAFAKLMEEKGISNDSTVVFYGDKSNWYATYTFWLFKIYGHRDARVMDGGRLKWEKEGREWSRQAASHGQGKYSAPEPDYSIRAFRDQTYKQMEDNKPLVDVRSPAEYKGELLHMVDYPQEGAQRGGHIPHAVNIPWGSAVNPDDGTLKSAVELKTIYQTNNNVSPNQEVISYCRIGERSSHTWFVLKYLLGYPNVRNYDGSWTECGNLVGAPIEK
ncbi:MAG: sulfurtransferase [Chloroflexota bacterium]